MPLYLDDDQTALQDTIRDFVAEHAPVSHMRALRDADDKTVETGLVSERQA